MGDPSISLQEIMGVAEYTGLIFFIQSQPQGFDTLLDPLGKRLPQSIRQRILLTRTLMGKSRLLLLEEHFLQSNITSIVRSRYNNEPLVTKSDFKLFYSLTNDPNDIICDNKSSIVDLYNRAQIQNQLWENVLNLRNGQYYGKQFRDFVSSVDICKLNKYDTPDLVYGRYDGTILKRLISAFSFRPTLVSTLPIYPSPIVNTNPYQQNITPMVTSVSMINIKLPPVINDNSPVDLNDSLQSNQFFLENGVVTPRNTSIIYSRGVLFFYVDRRANIIYNNQQFPSFVFNKIPTAVAGFERLNQRPVNFDPIIRIRNDEYRLRSVVVSEVNDLANERDLVIGSSALFMIHQDFTQNIFQDEFFIYDPYSVVKPALINNTVQKYNPIEMIGGVGLSDNELGFMDIARTRGIVFMYQLVKDSSSGIIMY
jgi:hypothetical protein